MKIQNIIKVSIIASLLISVAFGQAVSAKGSSGGRSSGGRISSSRSVSRPRTASARAAVPSKPSIPKVSTRPSSKTTTKVGTPKTISGKKFSGKGNVVDSNYQPKFSGGYAPPVGSTVYYRDNSMMSWLPFYMIMTNQQHREAVVTQPDGTEQVVKEEGTDSMYIWNWILTILFVGGVGAGIIYLVYKLTNKKYEY